MIVNLLLFFVWPLIPTKIYIFNNNLDAIKTITIFGKEYSKRVYGHAIHISIPENQAPMQMTSVRRG